MKQDYVLRRIKKAFDLIKANPRASYQEIADHIGCSKSNAQHIVARIASFGWIRPFKEWVVTKK